MIPGRRPTGSAQRVEKRVIEPARKLADRLDAAGAARDAAIVRQLLKSHGGQRSWIQIFQAGTARRASK